MFCIRRSCLFVFVVVVFAEGTPKIVKDVKLSARFRCHQPSRHCISFDGTSTEPVVATAKYSWEEGWDKLWIRVLPSVKSDLAMWAGGYLEGYLMKHDIEKNFINTTDDWFSHPSPSANGLAHPKPEHNASAVKEWLQTNYAWMKSRANEGRTNTSSFWDGVRLVLAQLEGMVAGLQAAGSRLTLEDVFLLNADGDLEDLAPMLSKKKSPLRDRCSALFKLAKDRSDIFFAHATWDHYDMMVRSLKVYDFELDGYPRYTVSFSSSPGFLSSNDDFFLTNKGLAVVETTNGIDNPALWSNIHPSSVLTWIRSCVANMFSTDGPTWASLFATANSGTYNDQWMVLDMKLFSPGKHLPSNTFIVLEQIPGEVVWQDLSEHLDSRGYWASYNVPVFPSVGKASNVPEYMHKIAPRALIFKQQQETVFDLTSLQHVIRYNDWQNDPLSKGDACNAISSRCDLNPLGSPSWQLDGGIDGKASSVSMALSLAFTAQNGPTTDNQPPFMWRAIPHHLALPHQGQPNLFNYSWIVFGPDDEVSDSDLSRLSNASMFFTIQNFLAFAIVAIAFSILFITVARHYSRNVRQPIPSDYKPLLAYFFFLSSRCLFLSHHSDSM